MVQCIPSAVIWYTRNRGSVVGSIGMRGRELGQRRCEDAMEMYVLGGLEDEEDA
jgi:hypothetical protein